MVLAATMAYILMSLFILSFTVDVKTVPVQIQEFHTSSLPSEESSTDIYSLTTTDSTGAGKNYHLNMSNYEKVAHNPPVIDGSTLIPSWFTLPVETHVSNNTSGSPSEENKKSTDVYPLTMMLTTTDSIEIENDSQNMPNTEKVAHNPPVIDGSTLIPTWFTLPVKTHVSNNTSGPLSEEDKKSTDVHPLTMMFTTTDSIEIENDSHNMPNTEKVTHNPPVVDDSTLIPSWFTLPVEIPVSNNASGPPSEENKKSTDVHTITMMLTTTDSIEIENDSHNMPNTEKVTHNPPVVDGSTFIPSWFTLPVKTHVSNNISGPLSEEDKKSTDEHPLTMMLTTTDSIEIENDSQNMPNTEKVTHNPPVVDGLTLIPSWFTLPVEAHVSNNTSGPPSEENSTYVYPSLTKISTLNSVETSKDVPIVAPSDIKLLVTHNLSDLDCSNISHVHTFTVKEPMYNTAHRSFTENSTYTYHSEIILTTATDSTDTEYAPFNMSNYKDVCGRQLVPISRIVGGDKVSFGEWPWQISLRHKNTYKHKCGAVLINENWAITTAHCVKNVSINDIHLVLGKYDFSVKDEPYGSLIRKLQTVIIHPKYNTYSMEYDLALLRFDENVIFQPNILPVCIPEDDSNFVGFSAHITGWGALYYGGISTIALQEATVSVLNNSVCENMFRAAGYIKKIPDTFICAGSKDGGHDACKGDSGGPMVVQRPDHRWVVAGIIAWGMRCGEPNSPGVYMRISKFKDWINKIILQSKIQGESSTFTKYNVTSVSHL